jgi:PTS system nitrogen regulatory IIA component
MHFGATLRLLRVSAGISLRELARRVGVSTAYLSRVENGHDGAPTPDRLVAIGRALDVPPHALLELARQAGSAVAGYVEEVPVAAALFLEISRRRLGPTEIARVKAFIEREFPPAATDRGRPPVRLSERLTPQRVVVDLVCTDLEELVDVAVTRLPIEAARRRAVAEAIMAVEEDAPSSLGNGVAIPHAAVAGAPSAAVLVTLARPLRARAADGSPVRLAIVLIDERAGAAQLALLAQAARLASAGVADTLASLRSAQRILDHLAALEACL